MPEKQHSLNSQAMGGGSAATGRLSLSVISWPNVIVSIVIVFAILLAIGKFGGR